MQCHAQVLDCLLTSLTLLSTAGLSGFDADGPGGDAAAERAAVAAAVAAAAPHRRMALSGLAGGGGPQPGSNFDGAAAGLGGTEAAGPGGVGGLRGRLLQDAGCALIALDTLLLLSREARIKVPTSSNRSRCARIIPNLPPSKLGKAPAYVILSPDMAVAPQTRLANHPWLCDALAALLEDDGLAVMRALLDAAAQASSQAHRRAKTGRHGGAQQLSLEGHPHSPLSTSQELEHRR